MLDTPQKYVDAVQGPGRVWIEEFLNYMAAKHGDIKPIMFRQCPMFKVGKTYVMFTVAKTHFSVHTLNFELIEQLKTVLPKADFGKGCVKVKFADESAKPVLKQLCDDAVKFGKSGETPADEANLDAEQSMENAFAGGKAKWLPLYKALLAQAKKALPPFIEHYPAVGIIWRHKVNFATVNATLSALRVEVYFDGLRPELNAVKTLVNSKHRVAHTFNVVSEQDFARMLPLINASYELTQSKRVVD